MKPTVFSQDNGVQSLFSISAIKDNCAEIKGAGGVALYVGVAVRHNDIITGSIPGDVCIRVGSGPVRFSRDNGVTGELLR